MSEIYDLSIKQLEILDMLFWEDDEQEIERLNKKLHEIQGSAENTVRFLSEILLETRAVKEARKEAKQKAEKRLKTAENAEQRLRDRILQIMQTFDIKKVYGDLCDIRQQANPVSVQYAVDFDPKSLPAQCINIVPAQYKPIASEVKKLIESGEYVPGVELIQTVGIRVS